MHFFLLFICKYSYSKDEKQSRNTIINQSNIDNSFKKKISSIIFNYEDDSETKPIKDFLKKFIHYWILRGIYSDDGDAKSKDINNLSDFNNHISHLLFNINNTRIFKYILSFIIFKCLTMQCSGRPQLRFQFRIFRAAPLTASRYADNSKLISIISANLGR